MSSPATREEIARVAKGGPFAPDWPSLQGVGVPSWYQDAKFGIFIHWGIYAVPAFGNQWYARQMYLPGHREYDHHRATYGSQDSFGYKDFIPQFSASAFDPNAWARVFRSGVPVPSSWCRLPNTTMGSPCTTRPCRTGRRPAWGHVAT